MPTASSSDLALVRGLCGGSWWWWVPLSQFVSSNWAWLLRAWPQRMLETLAWEAFTLHQLRVRKAWRWRSWRMEDLQCWQLAVPSPKASHSVRTTSHSFLSELRDFLEAAADVSEKMREAKCHTFSRQEHLWLFMMWRCGIMWLTATQPNWLMRYFMTYFVCLVSQISSSPEKCFKIRISNTPQLFFLRWSSNLRS